MHILKADQAVTGLYQFMLNEFLARRAGNSELVNLEQDMGLENLKKSKLSYHPVTMIKKYTLKQAPRRSA